MLQQKGYHTACIGKCHLSWKWQTHSGEPLIAGIEAGAFDQEQRKQIGKQVDLERPVLQGPITNGATGSVKKLGHNPS